MNIKYEICKCVRICFHFLLHGFHHSSVLTSEIKVLECQCNGYGRINTVQIDCFGKRLKS